MAKLNAARDALKEEARSLALKRASQEARLAKLQAVACIRNGFFSGSGSCLKRHSLRHLVSLFPVLRIRIRDPVPFFDPWIRDPGWVKNQDKDPV